MARKVIGAIVDTTGPQVTPLEDIPADVIEFVETTYAKQRKTPGRERVEYDTLDELKKDYKLMVDYCAQRPANKGGILAIRRSPTRGIPETVMDVRITADLEANGKANGQTTQKATAASK